MAGFAHPVQTPHAALSVQLNLQHANRIQHGWQHAFVDAVCIFLIQVLRCLLAVNGAGLVSGRDAYGWALWRELAGNEQGSYAGNESCHQPGQWPAALCCAGGFLGIRHIAKRSRK